MKGKQKFITEHPTLAYESLVEILKDEFGIYVYDDIIAEGYISDYSYVVSDVELTNDELYNVCKKHWEQFEDENI